MGVDILLGVPCRALLKLLFVLDGDGGSVFCLRVLAVEGGGPAVGLEEFGGRLVAAHLHDAELVPLPFCWKTKKKKKLDGSGTLRLANCGQSKAEEKRTVEVGGAHEGNVHAQVAVVGRAVETQVDAKGDGRPCGILLAAVEADLLVC